MFVMYITTTTCFGLFYSPSSCNTLHKTEVRSPRVLKYFAVFMFVFYVMYCLTMAYRKGQTCSSCYIHKKYIVMPTGRK